ncbi:MAG: hypothetical protein ACOC9W_00265 [Persicimonas sp.]
MAINRVTKSISIRGIRAILLIVGLGLFTLNCGGDDANEDSNSADDGFSSGVEGEKRTGDLSDDEEQAICDEMIDYGDFALSQEARCKLHASGGFGVPEEDAALQQYCQERFDDCVEGDEFADPERYCVEAPEGCTATVAELEGCLELHLTELNEYFIDTVPECESVTRAELDEFNDEFERSVYFSLPPECEAIDDECDGYFREDLSMH